MVESFWTIPDAVHLRTPLAILREQASALTAQTQGLLVGVVDVLFGSRGVLFVNLEIRVPALNDYRARILTYEQPIAMYPGIISGMGDETEWKVDSEDRFIELVKSMLASHEVTTLLSSLLAQSTQLDPIDKPRTGIRV